MTPNAKQKPDNPMADMIDGLISDAVANRVADLVVERVSAVLRNFASERDVAPAPGPHEWMTSAEAAAHIRLSGDRFEKLRKKGEGPPHVGTGKRIRYERGALDAWVAGHNVQEGN